MTGSSASFFFFFPIGISLIHSPEFQFLGVLEFTREVVMVVDTPFMISAGSPITVCLLLDAVSFGFIYIYIYKWGGMVWVSGLLSYLCWWPSE